jgi:putative intracellular protease/amidase
MTEPPRLFLSPQAPPLPVRFAGKPLLMVLAARGHAVQEVIKPLALLEQAGCPVTLASLDGGSIRFDPLCNVLALLGAPWDPTWRLLRRAVGDGRFENVLSLRALEREGGIDQWLDGYAAVIVPGGHGRTFAGFLSDRLVVRTVTRFHSRGKPLAFLCHAPFMTSLIPAGDRPLAAGRTLACWPRTYERRCALLPWLGRYMVPCGRPVGDLLAEAGATVLDAAAPEQRVHAVIDGQLVTGRGPWSTGAFAGAILEAVAAVPKKAEEH